MTFLNSLKKMTGRLRRAILSKRQKFESKYYCAIIEDGKVKFQTKDQEILIENLRFTYSACKIYNIRKKLTNPQEIELDQTTDLHIGDSVIVTNNMYGCSAKSSFWMSATIVSLKSGNCIGIDVSLPPHLMKRSAGLIVLKRTEHHDHLELQNLQVEPHFGGACIVFNVSCDHFNMSVRIKMSDHHPHIDIQSKTTYLKSCQLFHQGIVIQTPLALRELHLKNRVLQRVEDNQPQHDTWLWKEGCRVGTPKKGEWVIQHTPNIACIEVITGGKGYPWKSISPTKDPQVIINLEHYQAQRFRQVVNYDRGNQYPTYKELSVPHYEEGDEIDHSFRIFLGTNLPPAPRLMLTPKGFRASHVWTEHADTTTIQTHRAAYYGSEKIMCADQAVGGFVKYGHPVTKSIFYNYPHHKDLSFKSGDEFRFHKSDKTFYLFQLSYETDSEFQRFIDELSIHGHEICLHTAATVQMSPEKTHQAVREIATRYKSPTWIDHDYAFVRSCVSYEGAVPSSPYYMVKTWQTYGCRYFWHSASEDFMPLSKDGIDLLHNNSGPYTPTPLYWRVSAMPNDMITWAANECPLEYYKENVIDDLIKNRGISIHHHYYPYMEEVSWNTSSYKYNFIEKDPEQGFMATPAFNHVLSIMAHRQQMGELYLTTIGEIVSYWLALEHIQIELCMPDGFILINAGNEDIVGLAFVIRSAHIECREAPINFRSLDDGDTLVWCDMPAGGRYQFSVKF